MSEKPGFEPVPQPDKSTSSMEGTVDNPYNMYTSAQMEARKVYQGHVAEWEGKGLKPEEASIAAQFQMREEALRQQLIQELGIVDNTFSRKNIAEAYFGKASPTQSEIAEMQQVFNQTESTLPSTTPPQQ